MNYKSEVLLVLTENSLEELEKQANERFDNFSSKYKWTHLMNHSCYHAKNDETKNNLLYWDSVSWFSEATKFIDEFLSNLDDRQYLFIRIGDDPSDFVEKGYLDDPQFDVQLTHHLKFNKYDPENTIQENFVEITELFNKDIFRMILEHNKKNFDLKCLNKELKNEKI